MESQPPGKRFDLSSANHPPDHSHTHPDPTLSFLAEKYGFRSLRSDGWYIIHASYGGVDISFDVEKSPASLGYVKALEIAHGEFSINDDDDVTAEELSYLLRHWENPHAAADEVSRLRRLAATGAAGRDERGGEASG